MRKKAVKRPVRSDNRKRSIYLPASMMTQIEAEAVRQACSVSRIIRLSWVEAATKIRKYPDVSGAHSAS